MKADDAEHCAGGQRSRVRRLARHVPGCRFLATPARRSRGPRLPPRLTRAVDSAPAPARSVFSFICFLSSVVCGLRSSRAVLGSEASGQPCLGASFFGIYSERYLRKVPPKSCCEIARPVSFNPAVPRRPPHLSASPTQPPPRTHAGGPPGAGGRDLGKPTL